MNPQHFKAMVEKSGSRCLVAIPFDPHQVWGHKEQHHITGSINGNAYRGPILQEGQIFYISLGAAWREGAQVAEGDEVEVTLDSEGPQLGNMPEDLSQALAAAPKAKAFFEALPTFYRKNYLRWVESAKRPETRQARIHELIQLLEDGKREK